MSDNPAVMEAWRAVANAKLAEYRRQCWRLAAAVTRGEVEHTDAIDGLWRIAVAHALVRSLGEDRVQAIVADAFLGVGFRPLYASEIAA
jgi:hypothetical protein